MSDSTQQQSWQLNTVRTGPRGGTPVVLVHPVGLDLTYWDNQIAALRDRFDCRGLRPARPRQQPSRSRKTGACRRPCRSWNRWSSRRAARPLTSVGLSVGGVIAQAFALARPERVRSLALLSTAPTFLRAGPRKPCASGRTTRAPEACRPCCRSAWTAGLHRPRSRAGRT